MKIQFLSRFTSLENKALLLCAFLLIFFSYRLGVQNVLMWDVYGQYVYLPMLFSEGTFLFSDLSYFEKLNEIYQSTPYFYQFVSLENGNQITKYTAGTAVLLAPFYLLAELVARVFGFANDGFSLPYQYAVSFACTFYSLLGLYFLKKVLRHFFEGKIVALVLVLVVLGTNYLFHNYAAKGSTNNLEFFLIAWMLWQTILFHRRYELKHAIGLGISIGLIGLVRPPDLLVALVPATWNYANYGGLFGKLKSFLKQHKFKTLVAVGLAAALLLLQALYWKITAGEFLINSYANNPGEGFDWKTPYLTEVLFSFRKGWFLYTPLMLFAVVGMFLWAWTKQSGVFHLLTFFLFLYVVSSWTTWWYAESLSQRAMIDLYPLLAIGLGFFLQAVWVSRWKVVGFSVIGLLLVVSLFQTYQIDRGILHGSRMTQAYYFSTFGQASAPSDEQRELLLIDRIQKMETGFDNPDDYRLCFERKFNFENNFSFSEQIRYTPSVDILPSKISEKDHFWLRVTFRYAGTFADLKGRVFNAAILHGDKGYSYNGYFFDHPRIKIDTLQQTVEYDYLCPELRSPTDILRVSVYSESPDSLKIKGVHVRAYEPKQF